MKPFSEQTGNHLKKQGVGRCPVSPMRHESIYRKTLFLALGLVLVLACGVNALPEPNVTFIPDGFSANASFIAIADPGVYDDSVRVMWFFTGMSWNKTSYAHGLFPRMGGKWFCYFSNDDKTSTCGPSPFNAYSRYPGSAQYHNYTVILVTVTNSSVGNSSIKKNVGGITITPTVFIDTDNTAHVRVDTSPLADSVTYDVYTENMTLVKSGNLNYNPAQFAHIGNIALSNANYYIAFKANCSNCGSGGLHLSDYGGHLEKIVLVPTSGECPPCPGQGVITDDLIIDAVNENPMIYMGQVWKRSSYKIKNIGNRIWTSLSARVPTDISSYLSVTPQSDRLEPNQTIFFEVALRNIQTSMDINTNVDLYANSSLLGQIPISIKVSVMDQCQSSGNGGGQCDAGILSIDPVIWADDFVMNQEVASKTFTLTNNGETAITNIMSTDTLQGVASITTPTSIEAGGSGVVTVSLDPSSPGYYSGIITISSSAGSKKIAVSTRFFKDLPSSLDSLEQGLESVLNSLTQNQRNALSSITNNIYSDIETARSYFTENKYQKASDKYNELNAKIGLISDVAVLISGEPLPYPPDGGDMTIVLIGIVILAAGVGGWFFLKKFKKGGRGRSKEEEYEEAEKELEEEF